MDLGLYLRVLWRFKWIVALGFIAAVGLAVLSMARVSTKGLAYRQGEEWSSRARLLVTQEGFPEGRLLAQQPGQTTTTSGPLIADPARLNTLAILYAQLATSDPVKALIRQTGPIRGELAADAVTVGDNRVPLPLIDLTTIAQTRQGAVDLAARASAALLSYLEDQQTLNRVPASDRVVLQQVIRPGKVELVKGRSKTMPAVVFLAVMFATCGLAFLLENLRKRPEESKDSAAEVRGSTQRRIA